MNLLASSIGLLVWLVFPLLALILLIICFVDILKSSFKNNDKMIWLLVVLFVPLVGSILYFSMGRNQRLK